MNVEVIGTNAGVVWTALSTAESLTLKQVKKITKLKDKELFAALGWLAREGKLNISPVEGDDKELTLALIQG